MAVPIKQGVSPARRGRPRQRVAHDDQPVRVEVRLPIEVAALLFGAAELTGRTVSRVAADALREGIGRAAAM